MPCQGGPSSLTPLMLRVVFERLHRRLVLSNLLRHGTGIGPPSLVGRLGLELPEAHESFGCQTASFDRTEDLAPREPPRGLVRPATRCGSDAHGELEPSFERERHRAEPVLGVVHELEVVAVVLGV